MPQSTDVPSIEGHTTCKAPAPVPYIINPRDTLNSTMKDVIRSDTKANVIIPYHFPDIIFRQIQCLFIATPPGRLSGTALTFPHSLFASRWQFASLTRSCVACCLPWPSVGISGSFPVPECHVQQKQDLPCYQSYEYRQRPLAGQERLAVHQHAPYATAHTAYQDVGDTIVRISALHCVHLLHLIAGPRPPRRRGRWAIRQFRAPRPASPRRQRLDAGSVARKCGIPGCCRPPRRRRAGSRGQCMNFRRTPQDPPVMDAAGLGCARTPFVRRHEPSPLAM